MGELFGVFKSVDRRVVCGSLVFLFDPASLRYIGPLSAARPVGCEGGVFSPAAISGPHGRSMEARGGEGGV